MAMERRGWVGQICCICDLRRSVSSTGISVFPVGDRGSLTLLVRGPGLGNSRVMICMSSTPNEKLSNFSV